MKKLLEKGVFFYQADQYAPSGAQNGAEQEDFIFELVDDGKSYAVAGFAPSFTKADVIIPAVYKGLPVTKIKGKVLWMAKINSLIIPGSIKEIGGYAFSFCAKLTKVLIQEGVHTIGEAAFGANSTLKEIHIPQSVTSIERYAIQNCYELPSVTIPDKVACISYWTFGGCKNLKSIVIGKGVTKIERGAFYGCMKLDKVYYKGSYTDWQSVSIENTENECLYKARVYYYSESKPLQERDCWHYDGNGEPTPW